MRRVGLTMEKKAIVAVMLMLLFTGLAAASFDKCYAACYFDCIMHMKCTFPFVPKKFLRCAWRCLKKCISNRGSGSLMDLYQCKIRCSMDSCSDDVDVVQILNSNRIHLQDNNGADSGIDSDSSSIISEKEMIMHRYKSNMKTRDNSKADTGAVRYGFIDKTTEAAALPKNAHAIIAVAIFKNFDIVVLVTSARLAILIFISS